jgi:hypothetical protein
VLQKALSIGLAVALLAGGGVVAREWTRPASVTVEEHAISLEPGDTRAIHVHAEGGLPFGDAISWRIVPTWLGTISEAGVFRAGTLSASGSVIARFGSASTEIAVTVACPKNAEIQGVRFDVSCGRSADVYVDVAAYGGAALAAAAVDRDADRISRDLEIRSERRFRVYYFGTRQGFIAGVSDLGRAFSSGPTDLEADAVYIDVADAIAIDRSADLLMDTEGTLRHELVHRFLRNYVGYGNVDEVPTWLNEGWAFLEESGPASATRTEARLVSASMAHLGKLPSLRSLTGLREWNERTGTMGLYQYYAAAQAAQFLIDDVKLAGLHRILKRVRDGDSWAQAFSNAVPNVDYDRFLDRFSERVGALVQTYPGMVAVSGTPRGPGTSVIAYGLRPGVFATLKAKGPIDRKVSGSVDPYGVFVSYMESDFPAGEYVMTFDSGEKQLTITARH